MKVKTFNKNITFLKEKSSSLILYFVFFIIGIFLIILPYCCKAISCYKDIFLGFGCGLVPSALTGFLIEKINFNYEFKRKEEIKKSLLYDFVNSTIDIAKIFIENFCMNDDYEGNIYEIFNKSIEIAYKFDNDSELKDQKIKKEKRIYGLIYPCFIVFKRTGYEIYKNKISLIKDGIFNNEEMNIFFISFANYGEIEYEKTISGIACCAKDLIDESCKLTMIKEKFDLKIKIEEGKRFDWKSIYDNSLKIK